MKLRVLGVALFLLTAAVPAAGQDECPTGPSTRLVSNITPVIGQSPLWVAAGDKPFRWKGPNTPVKLLWIRDVTAKGPAWITGKARTGPGKAAFSRTLYGLPMDKLPLDALGEKIDGIREADLKRFVFYWVFVAFSTPGCYEITGRIKGQPTVIYLRSVPETS